MRITWVTRSFLDYRIPVYEELDRLCGHQLTLIYNSEVVPERCQKHIQSILGTRSIAMAGEKRVSGENYSPISTTKRKGIRVPFQPGLIRACRESAPEVCISDGFFQWTYAPLWMRIRYGIPHVMCYEPTKHTERNAQFYRTWYRRLASRWIDAICCNGTLCKEYCQDVLHISESKLSMGNMAADSTELARRCSLISDEQRKEFRNSHAVKGTVFLFVGRLVELKGIRYLLKAWKMACMENATLLLVGDGPEREELEKYVRQNGLSVVFVDNVDYDNIADYYRVSDVFIIPTLQDNWSLVVPEAMACGLPIACSIYNGCWPELVKPENGWVFDPLDIEATCKVLKNILDCSCSSSRLMEMGNASIRIVKDFSPSNVAFSIFNSCKKALSKSRV